MNFDEATNAHREWKVRLRAFVMGGSKETFDPVTVAKDDQCALGKWIHGAGAVHASDPAFGTLKLAHAHFHSEAAQVVRLVKAGDKAGANRHLQGAFTQESEKVFSAIRQLKVHA